MYHGTIRTKARQLPVYDLPGRCWLCGRFVTGSRDTPARRCDHCEVTWYQLRPGTDPAAPYQTEYALTKIRRNYLPRGLEGRPWDIFDNFLDHSEVKLPCPA